MAGGGVETVVVIQNFVHGSQEVLRVVRRGMEVADDPLLAVALERENRRRAIFPEGPDQLHLVSDWNGMTENKEVTRRLCTVTNSLSETQARGHMVATLLKQHAAGGQETSVV